MNIAPCGRMVMGEPAFLSEEFSHTIDPDIELVTTSGHGKNGAISVLQVSCDNVTSREGALSKCNFLRQIWAHPFDILHSSVQTTLGSVEQLISTQIACHNGILGTDCLVFDRPQCCLLRALSNIKRLGPNLTK